MTETVIDKRNTGLLNAALPRLSSGNMTGGMSKSALRRLAAALETAEIHIKRIDVGRRHGGVEFMLEHGSMGHHPEHGYFVESKDFGVQHGIAAGRGVRMKAPDTYHEKGFDTPEAAIAAYRDEATPVTQAGLAIMKALIDDPEARLSRELQAEDQVIAAFEALPPETVETFRTVMAYLALDERRSRRGMHADGPPIATLLVHRLDKVLGNGIPNALPGASTSSTFTW